MALNPKRVVLPNGITVLAKSNHTWPTVSLLVGVRTGAYSDPPEREGTAALCARVLDRVRNPILRLRLDSLSGGL